MKAIHTEKAPAAVGPYSQAIETGNLVFVSGQLPLDPATMKIVEGGIQAETERCLLNAQAILAQAGLTFNHVVKTTVLLDNIADFAAMNEVYAKYFVDHKPARAAFEVAKLPLGVAVEIEMIASRE